MTENEEASWETFLEIYKTYRDTQKENALLSSDDPEKRGKIKRKLLEFHVRTTPGLPNGAVDPQLANSPEFYETQATNILNGTASGTFKGVRTEAYEYLEAFGGDLVTKISPKTLEDKLSDVPIAGLPKNHPNADLHNSAALRHQTYEAYHALNSGLESDKMSIEKYSDNISKIIMQRVKEIGEASGLTEDQIKAGMKDAVLYMKQSPAHLRNVGRALEAEARKYFDSFFADPRTVEAGYTKAQYVSENLGSVQDKERVLDFLASMAPKKENN